MKSLFILNPRSGRRGRGDVAEAIRQGGAGEISRCESKGDLDGIISKAASDGVEVVYAVGGDGTVHEIAKRLVGTQMALGIVPAGSGNGLARHLGIPLVTEQAIRVCRDGVIETIDSATVNGLPFFGVMGVGLDATIAERFAASETRGMRTYVRLGFLTFMGFRAEHYDIEINGETQRRDALVLAVANSSQYGNNARIAPLASLQDGLLDVVIVEKASWLAAPRMLRRLFDGTFHQSKGVRFLQARQVKIRRASAGAAHLDGEPVTLPAELDVRIVPRSLRVLMPRGGTPPGSR
jgi:YegS/Rv2252/BmrU family lipid kinase